MFKPEVNIETVLSDRKNVEKDKKKKLFRET